jgi:hypothetical protein
MLCKLAFPDAEVTYISDFRHLGEVPVSEEFERRLADSAIEAQLDALIDDTNQYDIIARCRLLRFIQPHQARRMLAAMAVTLEELVDRYEPDIVLAYTIDSYVLDLLRYLVERRGARYLGLATVLINGFYRPTARGEYHRTRTPPPNVVESVLIDLLRQDYRPAYMLGGRWSLHSTRMLYQRSVERWASNLARWLLFGAKATLSREPHNYHNWSSAVVSRQLMQPLPPFVWTRDWRAVIERPGRKYYVPLQWSPEASIDYWCPSLDAIQYEKRMEEAIALLASSGQVLVKEHPAFWGNRPQSYYRSLMRHPNVVILPPDVPSQDLVALSDGVVVYTGSVGFEAALRGKPVAVMGEPYYRSGRLMHSVQTIEGLHVIARACTPAPVTREEQLAMVEHVLAGCLSGRFRDDGSFDASNAQHRQEIEVVAKSLSDYLNNEG